MDSTVTRVHRLDPLDGRLGSHKPSQHTPVVHGYHIRTGLRTHPSQVKNDERARERDASPLTTIERKLKCKPAAGLLCKSEFRSECT